MMGFPDIESTARAREQQAFAGPGNIMQMLFGIILVVVIGALIFMLGESAVNFGVAVGIVSFVAVCFLYITTTYKNVKGQKKDAYKTWINNIQTTAVVSCPDNIKNSKISLTGMKGFGGMVLGRIIGFIRLRDNTESGEKAWFNGIYYIAEKDKVLYLIPFFRPFIKVHNVFFYDRDIYGGTLIGDVSLMGTSMIPVGEWNYLNTMDVDPTKITANVAMPNSALNIAYQCLDLLAAVAFKGSMGDTDMLKMMMAQSKILGQQQGGAGGSPPL